MIYASIGKNSISHGTKLYHFRRYAKGFLILENGKFMNKTQDFLYLKMITDRTFIDLGIQIWKSKGRGIFVSLKETVIEFYLIT